MATFATLASSIFLEGLFFLIIGVFISAIIELFVSPSMLEKIIPKNIFLSLIVASVSGLIFPFCECAIVPITHRLIKKGIPLHIAIVMLFSIPIVNLIVIFSTYTAFTGHIFIPLLRISGGIIISLVLGCIIYKFYSKQNNILVNKNMAYLNCSHEHNQNHHEEITHNSLKSKIFLILKYSVEEFFETGVFFLLGIFIASLFQSLLPRNILVQLGRHNLLSNVFMEAFAYVLCVCSQTDAFIARTFFDQFTVGAVLSFMIFGAMMDIKTTVMLKKIFKTKFLLSLIVIVFMLNLIFGLIINLIFTGF